MTSYTQAKISDPSRYFETPDHVLNDGNLTHDEQVKVLRSMALDADHVLETTSEGMGGANLAYSAEDLQTALIQLEEIKEPETLDAEASRSTSFQRIVVVTTVNQRMNREISEVAIDMAELAGGRV